MKCKRDPKIKVNICWNVRDEKKCATLPKEEAYATRDWVEREGGVVYWSCPVEN
jgi:hypothetical protein